MHLFKALSCLEPVPKLASGTVLLNQGAIEISDRNHTRVNVLLCWHLEAAGYSAFGKHCSWLTGCLNFDVVSDQSQLSGFTGSAMTSNLS